LYINEERHGRNPFVNQVFSVDASDIQVQQEYLSQSLRKSGLFRPRPSLVLKKSGSETAHSRTSCQKPKNHPLHSFPTKFYSPHPVDIIKQVLLLRT